MKNKKERLDNFIPFLRSYRQDYLEGRLKPSEYFTYMHIRLCADKFGYAVISLQDIEDEVFKGKHADLSSVNKVVLALKRRGYIHYEERSGRRGSMRIKFGDFIMPSGEITRIENSKGIESRASAGVQTEKRVEQEQSLDGAKQRLESESEQIESNQNDSYGLSDSRGSDNDKDKEKDNIDSKLTPLKGFRPESREQSICYEIARELGEKDINFILYALKRYGLAAIEEMFGVYKEQVKKGAIENKGAYFNSLIQKHGSRRSTKIYDYDDI